MQRFTFFLTLTCPPVSSLSCRVSHAGGWIDVMILNMFRNIIGVYSMCVSVCVPPFACCQSSSPYLSIWPVQVCWWLCSASAGLPSMWIA